MIKPCVFMHTIGKIFVESHKSINIVQYHAQIGIRENSSPNTLWAARTPSIVWSAMDGKNWNITQCYFELNSVKIKIAIKLIVPFTTIARREDKSINSHNSEFLRLCQGIGSSKIHSKLETQDNNNNRRNLRSWVDRSIIL